MSKPKHKPLDGLEVRLITDAERSRWSELMKTHHYLGFSKLIGKRLCYVAILNGAWVALLSWSSAILKIQTREQWIGWDAFLKEQRLKYLANNSRFLILPGKRIKNLASKVLSLNLRRLSSDWEARYGNPIVMVETFVDPARFKGSCYLANEWQAIGLTKGYERVGLGYQYHGRRKTLFVKEVQPKARNLLHSPFLSPQLRSNPGRKKPMDVIDVNDLPLEGEGGLIDFLKKVKDPRKKRGIRYKAHSILALAVLAGLCEAKSYTAIHQWGKKVPKGALLKLGFKRGGKLCSETSIRRFLQKLPNGWVEKLVEEFRLRQQGKQNAAKPYEDVAMAGDGKVLRGSHDGDKKAHQLLGLALHEQGIVLAQRSVDAKSNEIPELKTLVGPMNIQGAIMTLDALHTQKETMRYLVEEKQCDYVLTAKDNQPSLKEAIASLDNEAFSPCV